MARKKKAKRGVHSSSVSIVVEREHDLDSGRMKLTIHVSGSEMVAFTTSDHGMDAWSIKAWFSDATYNGLNQVRDTIR